MKRLYAIAITAIMALALAAPVLAADPVRPILSVMSGEVTFEDDAGCPLGFATVTETSGWAAHLGRMTVRMRHCFTPPDLLAGGRVTFIAADGDEIHATYAGTADPAEPQTPGEVIIADFDVVVTGGTGRFAGADGEMHGLGRITFPGWEAPTWPASFRLTGTLSY